jgi:hypothetical protein
MTCRRTHGLCIQAYTFDLGGFQGLLDQNFSPRLLLNFKTQLASGPKKRPVESGSRPKASTIRCCPIETPAGLEIARYSADLESYYPPNRLIF